MDVKPQTLVVLSPAFPKDEEETMWLPLQQALLKNIKQAHPNLEILVIAFQYPHKKKNYSWHGISVMAFGGKGRGKLFRLYNWASLWATLLKIRRKKNIAGILSFWINECAFIGEHFAKRYDLKHYCWILGQDAKPDNRYVKLSGIKANSLLALSDLIASSMYINYGLMPKYTIPGGVDTDMFGGDDMIRDIDVLAAGSLSTLKQYHLFIEVVCRLKRYKPDIKAVLCGDGPDRARLLGMIRKLKMEAHITLTGELQHGEVIHYMQRSKIFLHPSSYEGLGMVCLEALYAGAKVISFVKPMDADIPNWHIAENTLQMANIAVAILNDPTITYSPTMVYNIKDIANRIAGLYANKPSAIALKRPAIALKESVEV